MILVTKPLNLLSVYNHLRQKWENGVHLGPIKEKLRPPHCALHSIANMLTLSFPFFKPKLQNSHYSSGKKDRTKIQLNPKMHRKEDCYPCPLKIILLTGCSMWRRRKRLKLGVRIPELSSWASACFQYTCIGSIITSLCPSVSL